jgi:hypothetical protein
LLKASDNTASKRFTSSYKCWLGDAAGDSSDILAPAINPIKQIAIKIGVFKMRFIARTVSSGIELSQALRLRQEPNETELSHLWRGEGGKYRELFHKISLGLHSGQRLARLIG